MGVLNIGIIGLGCVGMAVVEILKKHQSLIAQRCGYHLVIKKGVVQDLSKKRGVDFKLSDRIEDVLDDPDIHVVVELMGGIEGAFKVAQRALEQKKGFVTANKAMLAQHYYTLQNLAQTPMGFEASVGGGIPIIGVLKEGLGANEVVSIRGILNGTSNFILSQMAQGRSFVAALKEARSLGYAEANAHLDTSGQDSAHKLLVLAFLAFHIQPKLAEVHTEGIEHIKPIDMHYAHRLGYAIKLLGIANKQKQQVELSVCPVLLDQKSLLAQVNGVMNGICVVGDCVGETFYYGMGAGGLATASAVVSDLMAVARFLNTGVQKPTTPTPYHLKMPQEISSAYYLRVELASHQEALSAITPILDQCCIKIHAHFQEKRTHILTTETTTQANMDQALLFFKQSEYFKNAYAMRIDP